MNKILRYSFVALLAMMVGNVMAAYNLQKVTSVQDNGLYVFEQDGVVMGSTVSNNALQTLSSYAKTALEGTEAYVWKLEKSGSGFLMKNVSLLSNTYLKNSGSSTNVSFAAEGSVWAFNFQEGGTVAIQNTSNSDRFLGFMSATNKTYKAYAKSNLSGTTYPHAIVVYQLVDPSDSRTSTSIEFSGDYETWFAPSGPFDETYPVAAATVKAGDTPIDAIVTWTVEKKDDWAAYEGEGELTVADGKVSGIHKKSFGTLTLTASFAGDQANKPSTKSYDIKVCKIPNRIQDFYEWYGNKKENIAKGMPVCYFLIDLDENDTPTPRQELVTYVNGSNTYITDGKQGLLLYKTNLGLAVGDKITVAGATKADPIWGTLKSFNGTIEIAVDHMGVVKTSTGNEVTPIEITVDKITALDNFFTNWQGGKMTPLIENVFLSNYVTIKDAEYVGTSGSNEQFKVGDATFLVYKNGANITFEATAKYTLTGVGSSYNKSGDITPQLNYISSEMTAPASVNAIKTNGQFQGKMYNVAGQVVNKGYKGLVIQDGRKFVNK